MTSFAEAQDAVETSQQLADVLAEVISYTLDVLVSKATDLLINAGSDPGSVDRVVLAAAVQGSIVGILEFMAARSSEGRMDDPNGLLTTLFTGAAKTWDDIRSIGDPKVTLQ